MMDAQAPLIIIVDDDGLVRDALDNLFRSMGYTTQCFDNARDVLDLDLAGQLACIITDVRMPRMGGLEFQKMLAENQNFAPVIFITGFGDIP
jgi:FixJ family two-component response regulator